MYLIFWNEKSHEAEKKKNRLFKTKNHLKRIVSKIVVSSVE